MSPMQAPDLDELYGADVRRANRRRLRVFLAVFLLVAVAGLVWDFSRSPEYRASARLQITPPVLTLADSKDGAAPPTSEQAFLTEVQTLSSRPLIEQVAARLRAAGHDLNALGLDPILALQSALTVTAVEGTQVAELVALGRQPELPAALLAGIGDVYREHIAQTYRENTGEASARADEEVVRLEAAVAAKRQAVEKFRLDHSIVSPEREENSILAEMQGLSRSQQDAHKRLMEAEGKVEALRAAAAAGKGVVRAKDNPTLASLESRASQVREELRELGRQFTPEYLDADPKVRALRTRLAELEEQIRSQRSTGQSLALEEAGQELAAARESSRRLQQQIAASRQQAGAFAARFSQYKSLQEELVQLEKTYQDAQQRQARLGATERSRMPALQILEQAVIPKEPWRPLYWRDAGLVLVAALLLALGAMWLVELFNRAAPKPSVLVTQPVFSGALLPGQRLPELAGVTPNRQLPLDDRPRLAAPLSLPRELTAQEVAALLRDGGTDVRRAVALLLSGLSADEALALRWSDIDAPAGVVRVIGAQPRQVMLPAGAMALVSKGAADAAAHVLQATDGEPITPQALASMLLVGAHDAGIDQAQEIDATALRHTYIAFLVRQGARFADITRCTGALGSEQLSVYSQLAPAGARRDAAAVQWEFPAFAQATPA
jgi:uncharacterized protein involved in exopolysaccharide biosynthesis